MQNYSNLQGAYAEGTESGDVEVTTEDGYVFWVSKDGIDYAGTTDNVRPSTPKGWEGEKGTGKGPGGNGVEEGKDVGTTNPEAPSDKESWIDPSDPETKLPTDEPISPVYSKTVSIIYKK